MSFVAKSISRTLCGAMIGFGVVMGIIFPFFTRAVLGVPKSQVFSFLFFSMCIGAGLLVGIFNFSIFRLIVYKILRRMTGKLGDFRSKLASFSADRTIGCTPEECHLAVDSRDTIGELAGGFNTLVDTIYQFVTFERAT
jgi:phosphate/sulfate permease